MSKANAGFSDHRNVSHLFRINPMHRNEQELITFLPGKTNDFKRDIEKKLEKKQHQAYLLCFMYRRMQVEDKRSFVLAC